MISGQIQSILTGTISDVRSSTTFGACGGVTRMSRSCFARRRRRSQTGHSVEPQRLPLRQRFTMRANARSRFPPLCHRLRRRFLSAPASSKVADSAAQDVFQERRSAVMG
jgi:hypothetical protein